MVFGELLGDGLFLRLSGSLPAHRRCQNGSRPKRFLFDPVSQELDRPLGIEVCRVINLVNDVHTGTVVVPHILLAIGIQALRRVNIIRAI